MTQGSENAASNPRQMPNAQELSPSRCTRKFRPYLHGELPHGDMSTVKSHSNVSSCSPGRASASTHDGLGGLPASRPQIGSPLPTC